MSLNVQHAKMSPAGRDSNLASAHPRRRHLVTTLVSAGLGAAVGLAALALGHGSAVAELFDSAPDEVPSALPGSPIITYAVDVLDANGLAVEGTFDVEGVLYQGGTEVMRQSVTADVAAGRLVVPLRLDGTTEGMTGTGLTPDQLDAAYAAGLEIEVFIDGASMGPPEELARVPGAVAASSVTAGNIAYGGTNGFIDRSLVPNSTVVRQYMLRPEQAMPTAPAAPAAPAAEIEVSPARPNPPVPADVADLDEDLFEFDEVFSL